MLKHDVQARERLETAVRNDIDRPPLRSQALIWEEMFVMFFKRYLFAQKRTMKQYHEPQKEQCLLRA